jgi:hypothetical protein
MTYKSGDGQALTLSAVTYARESHATDVQGSEQSVPGYSSR